MRADFRSVLSRRVPATIMSTARLLLIAAAFSGCATMSSRGLAASPAVDVSTYAQLLRMADVRELDRSLAERAFADTSRVMRVAAIRAVAWSGGRELAPALRNMLTERDTAVAAEAAFALGLMRDTASIPVLAAALTGRTQVAVEAAWSLGNIGAPARDQIENALRRGAGDSAVTGALLLAAARLQPAPVELAAQYARNPYAGVRWRAAYVIARPLSPAGVRVLLTLVRDNDPLVRAQVARGMAKAATGDSLATEALTALGALSQDRDPHVRAAAARALASHGEAGRAALLPLVRDLDANVRTAAVQALPSAAGDAVDWAELWEADTASIVRRAVLAGAASRGVILPAADTSHAVSWRSDADPAKRAAAAASYAALPRGRDRIAHARAMLEDPEPVVRLAALGAIAPHADSIDAHAERADMVRMAVEDTDPYVRAAALGMLARVGDARDVAMVLHAFRAAHRDQVNDALLASIQALGAIWRRDSVAVNEMMGESLTRLEPPNDHLTRSAGALLPPLAHWSGSTVDPRHITWYETRAREIVLPAVGGRLPRVELRTDRGPIVIELFALDAPLTVHNFLSLAADGYFDGSRFHRVVPAFVAQGGDPTGTGSGGPSWAIRDEINRRRYVRGAVGMALSGPDTGGSQFFLTLAPAPHLDGGYTVFGRVVSGQPAMDALVQGDLLRAVVVLP